MAKQTEPRRKTNSPVSSRSGQQANRAGQPARPARTSRNSERARQQRQRRRRRNKLVFRVVCGLLICAAIVLAPTVFFRVSHITVTGDTRYTEQELIDASGVREGDNMFFLDSSHIAQILQAKYPYLDTVKLHRRLPSTLQIEITERTAALSVEVNGEYLLMDMTGKVLEKNGQVADNTVEVVGAEAEKLKVGDTVGDEQEKLQTVLDLMNLMTQYEMNDKVGSIDIEKAYDVRMRFDDRYTILLGNLSDLEHKIQFLQAILKEPSLPETGIIDLTDDKKAHYRPDDTVSTSEEQDDTEEADDAVETGQSGDSTDDGQEQDSTDDSAEQEETGADDASGQEEQADTGAQDGDSSQENSDGQTTGVVLYGKIIL